MNIAIDQAAPFKAGMYLLDSFTSGMYNDPLIVYREYIQNAVDSIDLSCDSDTTSLEVTIQLEPGTRTITIRDNAMGVPSALAEEVLSSVGSSSKTGIGMRGFRGIGRLGGIAFSDRAVFRTKAKNESVESIQEWDCRGLRKLLAEQRNNLLSLEQVFFRVTSFRQEQCSRTDESYFEVKLSGVTSFRNQIFDLEKVRRYLSQVTPVPFNAQEFSYAQVIDEYLASRLSSYGRYAITLNGELIRKPYKDTVRIGKGGIDNVDGIEFFKITHGKDRPIAYGWYGRRRELLGAIVRGEDSSGVRVRVGNIQIGDAHLLDFCYREPRFNGYVIGEVHVDCHDLIPNSRRDDFVDNMNKGIFYNLIEKNVGLPISKEIRLRSRLASTNKSFSSKSEEKDESLYEDSAKKLTENDQPFSSTISTESMEENVQRTEDLSAANPFLNTSVEEITSPTDAVVTLQGVCRGCPNLPKILTILDL